jgi:glycosyltransferase involved in cell wall biosynthesis
MKIVIIGTAYPHRGGIAHFIGLLFKTLADRGHDVTLFSFTRQYPSLFFPGKTQMETGPDFLHTPSQPVLDSINPFSWIKVGLMVRKINPDVVIFKYWMPFFAPAFATISRLAKLRRSTRVLYICDNVIPHEKRPGDRLLTKQAMRPEDLYIVMSASVEKDLLQLRPLARYRMVQHPVYEIFQGRFSKAQAKARLRLGDHPYILFFGYIRPYKGLQVLLEAMALLRRKMDVRLIVAGEFYDDKAKYLEQISRLDLQQAVTVLDQYIPNDEVGLYYAAADAVALPYISATQSGIVQICYHYDKPVIATDVGGLPEVVHDGRTGFIVAANDANAFAEAILRFYRENREAEFSRHVAEAKKEFSWERMAEAVEALAGDLQK